MHALTVAARNQLAQASVLADSYSAAHPDSDFTILLLDAEPGEYADGPNYRVATPADVPLDERDFYRMAMLVDGAGLAETLKPWAIQMMLDTGAEVVLCLDPDVVIYGPLDEIESLARKSSIVLLPQVTQPVPRDGLRPSEGELLAAGIYDRGFMAFSEDAAHMLDWWKDGLWREAHLPPHQSLGFVHRWIDLVPAYFEHAILRDPGYNVGYRNLDSRAVVRDGTQIKVNGSALRSCHFSGYDPEVPWALSREVSDLPRVVLSEHPVLGDLCDAYGRELSTAAARIGPAVPFRFDQLADGTPVNTALRESYRNALADTERRDVAEPPTPFIGHDEDLTNWFREPVRPHHHVNRFLYGVWENRSDLRNAFPDPLGADEAEFINWAWRSRDLDSHLVAGLLPDQFVPERLPTLSTHEAGVNLAGYFRAELGVGEMARLLVDGVKSCGLPYNTVTTKQTASRQNAEFDEAGSVVRYPVTIAAVNADVFLPWAHEAGPELLKGRYVAALWAWEVEEFPDYSTEVALVDEVWTLSSFARAAMVRTIDKPVHVIPLPVHQPPPHAPLGREAIGLPDGPYFLFAFDYFSTIERKNPFAVINAFTKAFDEGTGPTLVIKSINGDKRRTDRERLRRACSRRRDILLIEDYLDAPVVSSLMGEATAYVSLHRAEGFGLTMAEAMARGRPVIATGYSGNLEFMTPDNSMLVPFTRVPVLPGSDPYPTTTYWAEPDIDVAASYLRWVVENPSKAAALGARGRTSVLETCRIERTTEFINERVAAMLKASRSKSISRTKMAGRDEKRSNDPELTSEDAISRARSLIDRSPDFDAPSRLPKLAAQFRRLVHRTLAHHDKQSRTQLNAVVDALENVERRQAAVEVTMRGLASDIALQNERIGEVAASATTARRELIELGKTIPQPDPDPDS